MTKTIILIPRIKIHNANASASPYSIGFPAMTAWLGATHALERKIRQDKRFNEDLDDLKFLSTGVVCHDFKLHTYKGTNNFDHVLVGTGNPLDKKGNRPSFIEEARCDLTISLLIEFQADDDSELIDAINRILPTLKLAGGDIQRFGEPQYHTLREEADHHALIGKVMPGFCLIQRKELMLQAMETGQDALDALLDCLKVTHHCEMNDDGKATWTSKRQHKGWLIPIAIGFQGISDLAQAEQQRDPDTPHRFAESIITLGEFVMPYRLEHIDSMLWRYDYQPEEDLYLCQPKQSETPHYKEI
jgi:CRISPR-associated protein Csy2